AKGEDRGPLLIGLGWWLAALLPVLPLSHHTYLYYLYAPWAGGAIAVAAAARAAGRLSPRFGVAAGLVCLAAFAAIETRNIRIREAATLDSLPIDRTIRDATLLRHALPTLQRAGLLPGTSVAFVNPVPGTRFDLVRGAPTAPSDTSERTSYYPLEAAFRNGETLRLFVPHLHYLGFSNTVP